MRRKGYPVCLAMTLAATAGFADPGEGSKAGDERQIQGIRLCWCPPGQFTMGSPPAEPERRPGEDQVEVTLTRGFWIGKYEVTQGDWKRVVGKLPGQLTAELPAGDDFPVGNVNFAEAEAFCRKLTELARKSGDLPEDWEFRLPTEAQWEYACRAGTTTATSFGDTLSSKQANFQGKPYNGGAEEGPSLEAGGQGRQLPGQRLGPARHARQHLRVVPGLVSREAARRRRPGPVFGTPDDLQEPGRHRLPGAPGRRVDRRRLALPVGLPPAVRAGAAIRPHRVPGRGGGAAVGRVATSVGRRRTPTGS